MRRVTCRRFARCRSGGVAVSTAVLVSLLAGIAGLAVEVGTWYQTKRAMQGAADMAAVSAAKALTGAGSCSSGSACTWAAGLHGLAVAAENGWQHSSTNGIEVQVVSPPTKSGSPFLNDPTAVEVWISQPQSTLFGAAAELLAPTVAAYAIATTGAGSGSARGGACVLALANAANAVQVDGTGDISADCGIAVDGGRDQNIGGTPLGGLHFNGAQARVNVPRLAVASSGTECPDAAHCFLFNSTTPLPAAAVQTSRATADPFASIPFPTPPQGVASGGVAIATPGSGYKDGTHTFTVKGGSGVPATFTATVSGGKVTAVLSVTDPGAYTTMPANPVSANPDNGGGTGATFTLTQGCFTWSGTPLPGRKYCSINLNAAGTTHFPDGSYYIAGGDAGCVGFCVSNADATVTTKAEGVTFYLTSGEGGGAFGTSSYARVSISSGDITLCAPATNCRPKCDHDACILFFQDPSASATAALDPTGGGPQPASTGNLFSGDGRRALFGLVYLPNQTYSMSGNPSAVGCTAVVAKYVGVAGAARFSDACLPESGIGAANATTATLAE